MGKRVNQSSEFCWQMPQGGIDKGELPRDAALRELREETGISSVSDVQELDGWFSYDLPDELMGKALKGRYRGQTQKWFVMRFAGDESEIDLAYDGKPEFSEWRWESLDELPGLIVPFKRGVYVRVVEAVKVVLE